MEWKSNKEQARWIESHRKMIALSQKVLVIILKVKYTKLCH